jgi:hypothetical protein
LKGVVCSNPFVWVVGFFKRFLAPEKERAKKRKGEKKRRKKVKGI